MRADDLVDARLVALLGGADEVVVGHAQTRPQLVVALDHTVGQRQRLHALLLRHALDVLAVLVGAGEEVDVVARMR